MTESAAVYGKALFELAAEAGSDKRVLEELQDVCRILREEPEYVRLADAYTLSRKTRVDMVDKAFSGNVDGIILNTVKLLTEKNALHLLPACLKAYRTCYNEAHRITNAVITSAVDLTEDQKGRLLARLEARSGKRVVAQWRTDPAVRGGIHVDMDGVTYDNTIESRLNRLTRALSGGT